MATNELFAPPPAPAPTGLDLLYGVLFRPTATFKATGAETPLAMGAAAMLAVAVVMGFAFAPQRPGAVVLASLIALGWLFLSWLLLTGSLFIVGRFMVGRGEVQPLMAGTALAFLPFILVGPMAAFAGWGRGGVLLAAIFFVAAVMWWLRILQAAARGIMDLTSGQAVLAIVGMELLLAAVPMTYMTLWIMTLVLAIG